MRCKGRYGGLGVEKGCSPIRERGKSCIIMENGTRRCRWELKFFFVFLFFVRVFSWGAKVETDDTDR